jgi:hypothetical protein
MHGEFLQQTYKCMTVVKPDRENQKFENSDEKPSSGSDVKLFGAKAWRRFSNVKFSQSFKSNQVSWCNSFEFSFWEFKNFQIFEENIQTACNKFGLKCFDADRVDVVVAFATHVNSLKRSDFGVCFDEERIARRHVTSVVRWIAPNNIFKDASHDQFHIFDFDV